MIIERTSYPCISGTIVFNQVLSTAYGTFKIQCRKFSKDKNVVVIHEYDVCNRCVAVDYYRYCSRFHFSQAVKQIFASVYDLWIDFNCKEFFITEFDNGYSD